MVPKNADGQTEDRRKRCFVVFVFLRVFLHSICLVFCIFYFSIITYLHMVVHDDVMVVGFGFVVVTVDVCLL